MISTGRMYSTASRYLGCIFTLLVGSRRRCCNPDTGVPRCLYCDDGYVRVLIVVESLGGMFRDWQKAGFLVHQRHRSRKASAAVPLRATTNNRCLRDLEIRKCQVWSNW